MVTNAYHSAIFVFFSKSNRYKPTYERCLVH